MNAYPALNEYDREPVRGLPEPLPAGEKLLWQGAPCWTNLARRAFHIRKLAIYFSIFLVWRVGAAVSGGDALAAAGASSLGLFLVAAAAIGLLLLMAWLIGRTTVYTITNRRVVIRFGIALPMSVNVPFGIIESVELKTYADGSGDIPLSLSAAERLGYVILWPHVRRWRIAKPQPMLRAIPEAAKVAAILAQALPASAPRAADVRQDDSRQADTVGASSRPRETAVA